MISALLPACILLFLLVFPSPVFSATSVSVSSIPVSVDKEQEIEINITLSCTSCSSDSYLRGVFYPSGTSYFGYTQNKQGDWTNAPGGNCVEYYKVIPSELIEGSWSGKLKIKPDTTSSYYAGPGEYLLKVGRYTGSCGSPTWSQESNIAITGLTITPTPTNTLAPTPTPSTTSAPTATSVPTATSTPIATPTRTVSPTPTTEISDEIISTDVPLVPAILGIEDTSVSGTVETRVVSKRPFIIAMLFVSVGLALFAIASLITKIDI